MGAVHLVALYQGTGDGNEILGSSAGLGGISCSPMRCSARTARRTLLSQRDRRSHSGRAEGIEVSGEASPSRCS